MFRFRGGADRADREIKKLPPGGQDRKGSKAKYDRIIIHQDGEICNRDMSKIKDISGQRFGRLVVIRREGSSPLGVAKWHCQCDCGKECVVEGAKLRKHNTMSCGCLHDDLAAERRTVHGKSSSRLYAVWKSMTQRCNNPNNKNYDIYGGRGITVCDAWQSSFQAFYSWAMANGYDENAPAGQCTIDRIDNDKGYSPDNCRWVDQKTQNNNKRR